MFDILIPLFTSILIVLAVIFVVSKFVQRSSGDWQFFDTETEESEITDEANIAGIEGECKAFTYLSKLLKDNEFILKSLLIPTDSGRVTEIDCVLITYRGLFCIEVKNWSGKIMGGNTDPVWRQIYEKPKRLPRYQKNPVLQNQNHCEFLVKLLNYKFSIYNVVLFLNQGKLRYIQSRNAFTLKTFEECYNQLSTNKLNKNEIDEIKCCLQPFESKRNKLYDSIPQTQTLLVQ